MTPEELEIEQKDVTRQKALSAFETMRQSLVSSGMPQMSLDEINAEIKAAREERKGKVYAVIDPNVLVSSLFSSAGMSNPARVIGDWLNTYRSPRKRTI